MTSATSSGKAGTIPSNDGRRSGDIDGSLSAFGCVKNNDYKFEHVRKELSAQNNVSYKLP